LRLYIQVIKFPDLVISITYDALNPTATEDVTLPQVFSIAWTYRWVFLAALLVPFCISSIVILRLPERYTVISSIELATTLVQGRTQLVEPADQVAKLAIDQYLPIVLAGLETTQSSNLRAHAAGSTVILTESGPLASENRLKDLQEKILGFILRQQKQQANVIRENLTINLNSAKRRIESYDQQIKTIDNRKSEFEARIATQRRSVDTIQKNLAETLRSASPDARIQDAFTNEAKVREFRERLHTEETFSHQIELARTSLDSEAAKIISQRDEQYLTASQNEFLLNSIRDAHVLLQPTKMSGANGPRLLLLILAALVGSLIFATIIVLALGQFRSSPAR